MNLLSTLREPFRTTCEQIFNPPKQGVVEWRAVRALFREIGETKWLPNGDLKVTRNGHELILRPPLAKDVAGPDEFFELQRFIEQSETVSPVVEALRNAKAPEPVEPGRAPPLPVRGVSPKRS